MKSVIQFLVILATLAGMIILALLAKSTDEANTNASVIYGVLAILVVAALVLLFRWDKKRIQDEELELQRRVDARIKAELNYKQPVEFYAKPTQFVFLAFMLILSFGAIYFGAYLLIDLPVTNWLVGSSFLSGGIVFSIALIVSGKRLIGRPVISLDIRGLAHFRFGFIPWSEVNEIFLQTVTIKGNEVFFLKIGTRNNEFYQTRLPRWLRVFHKMEPGGLSLALPLSKENAHVVEGIADAYAEYAGAPTLGNIISRKLAEEISTLQTGQQRMQRLQDLMKESSQDFINRRQAISRAYIVSAMILILGVIGICAGAWITSK
ncbi:hypothetical protein [Methylomonas methanica]|uniref:Uncharacterized protein n=1 Tax=Methylomonas methanica TaxID=421 RepID=A0A177MS97_METMH|nr:hypothetical protein [Methylomonas methanica]OAI08551.1 hypothetical protein A1332_07200 [Methylomonas methanica]